MESGLDIAFYDAHLALTLLGCQRPSDLDKIIDRYSDKLLKAENKILEEWELELIAEMHQMEMLHSGGHVVS